MPSVLSTAGGANPQETRVTLPTDSELEAYKRARAAIRNLRKDRDFQWWTDYGIGADTARREAMRAAFTNNPIGKAYNLEHARIMKREKLIDLSNPNAPFPDPNSRKDAIIMVENLHHPADSRRFKGILAWREGLTVSERSKLNHPTAILRRWRKDTEPIEDKRARELTSEQQEPKEDPMLSLVADTEGERDEARRHAEDLRGLLGRILEEVEDLPEDLRAAIEQALASR
jgi:hypothetical protein